MISVIVSYTVKPAYVAENKQHIQTFLKDFEKLDNTLFSYNVHTKEDGNSFVHISSYKNKEVQSEVLNVETFKQFQQKRDESGLIGEPVIEVLEWIGGTSAL